MSINISKTIVLNELPSDLLSQIPFSLRTAKSSYLFSELPVEIQYLIEKYYEQKVPEIDYSSIYDAEFEMSAYSDFKVISSKKQLGTTYLKNYLNIRIGSFPYDVNCGCALKDQLQTRDTSLRQTLISNELYLVAGVIGADYDLGITITNFNVIPREDYEKTEYFLDLTVNVNDETTQVTA